MDRTFIHQSQSDKALIKLVDLQENPNLAKSAKLAHWASRYKKGIDLVHSRKNIDNKLKPLPIRLSFSKIPKISSRKSPELVKPVQYIRKLTRSFQFFKNSDMNRWIRNPEPKITLKLSGKALHNSEPIAQNRLENSIIRSDLVKTSYSLLRILRINKQINSQGSHSIIA